MPKKALPLPLEPGRSSDERPTATDRWWPAVGALALLAVVLGALATLQLRGTPHPPFDPWYHLELARQWRAGRGLSSSAEIAAGYPLFVAGVDLLRPTFVGLSLALGLTQSILLGVNVVLSALLGRRIGPPWLGLAAAAVIAMWPNLVLAAPLALAETLTITCALGVVVLLSARPRPSLGRLVGAGALVAVGTELRPGMILLLALFPLVAGGARERLRDLAIGAVVAVALIVPFALRSSYVTRSVVLFDLRAGVNLCLGRAPGADHPPVDRAECPIPDDATALEADDLRMHQAWEALRSDPWREPGLVVTRGRVTLWDADRSSLDELFRQHGHHLGTATDQWLDRISTLLSRLTLVFAVVGAALAVARRDSPVLRVTAGAVLLLLPALIALGDARYRMPAIPLLVVVALSTFRGRVSEPGTEPDERGRAHPGRSTRDGPGRP